jgi:hypothetical protein
VESTKGRLFSLPSDGGTESAAVLTMIPHGVVLIILMCLNPVRPEITREVAPSP